MIYRSTGKPNAMSGILSKQPVLQKTRGVDPYEFERFVAEIWENRGFNTTVRDGSGDRGIDVVAESRDEKILIQVKRYSAENKVGSQEVRNYATLYQQVEDAHQVVLVTSGYFTSEAENLAEDLSVEPVDADSLFRLIEEYAAEEAVSLLNTSSNGGSRGNTSLRSNSDSVSRIDAEEIFSDLNGYRRVSNQQGIFHGCPRCGRQRICLAFREDGLVELRCPDCVSRWVEIEEKVGWWIFSRMDHWGFAEIVDGKVKEEKTTEDWNMLYQST